MAAQVVLGFGGVELVDQICLREKFGQREVDQGPLGSHGVELVG